MSATESGAYKYIPCQGGHQFIYSGNAMDGSIPEGTICECGAMKARHIICNGCGQVKIEAIPVSDMVIARLRAAKEGK